MHIPKRVQKVKVLYYYFLFLYAFGLSTLSSCGIPEKQQTEDIDEDKDDEKSDIDAHYEIDDNTWIDEDLLDVDRFDGEGFDNSQIDEDVIVFDEDELAVDEDIITCSMPALSKNWAQIMLFEGYTKAPIVNTIPAWSIMIARISLSQDCEKITTTYKMCSIEVDDGSALIEAVVPPSFYQSLPLVDKNVLLQKVGDETHFIQPTHYEHRSCLANNPEDDMPADKNDSRVEDWDGDGIPGLMMHASGAINGDVSMCQKIETTLDGLVSANKIEGLVEWFEWQQVYQYSNTLLKDGSPTFPGEDKSKSYFYMVPIGESDDCDYILEHKTELFDGYIPAPGK
ncbi:hypothetical protein KAH37_06755 [bacterium]|nr:hypothetical protein [bacterium]